MIASRIQSLIPLPAEYVAYDGKVYLVVIEWAYRITNEAEIRFEDNSLMIVPCEWLRSVGDTPRLRSRIDTRKCCRRCGALLTEDNAPPAVVRRGGRCRACRSERNMELKAQREVAA